MRAKVVLPALLALFLSHVLPSRFTSPLAAQEAVAREIERLENVWVAAELKKDTAAVAPLLADDYLNVGNDGKRMNKAEYLQAMSRDKSEYLSNVGSDYRVQVYGNTAIIHGLSTQTIKTARAPRHYRYRWTDIWIRQADGRWLSVGGQNCPVN